MIYTGPESDNRTSTVTSDNRYTPEELKKATMTKYPTSRYLYPGPLIPFHASDSSIDYSKHRSTISPTSRHVVNESPSFRKPAAAVGLGISLPRPKGTYVEEVSNEFKYT